MTETELEKLRDLEQGIIVAIGADLETGSHHLNNTAHAEFARRFPSVMDAVAALGAWINSHEDKADGL